MQLAMLDAQEIHEIDNSGYLLKIDHIIALRWRKYCRWNSTVADEFQRRRPLVSGGDCAVTEVVSWGRKAK
jgi:hypothetical protein